MATDRRLIVVSNRLPVTVQENHHGLTLEPSSGGLVTALRPVLWQRSGYWIGWTGTEHSDEVATLFREHHSDRYELVPLFLNSEEKANFYYGFSNEILWPLFHDMHAQCNYDPAYWDAYCRVNDKFADAVLRVAADGDFIWVQDYHLMRVAESARKLGAQVEMAYFHHIPFPSPDIFEKLPWRSEVLRALLQYDLLGFQTRRDRRNFVACVRRFVPEACITKVGNPRIVTTPAGRTLLGDFPIGIDFDEFAGGADCPAVAAMAAQMKRDLTGCRILLGVDRLDYTKGIPERLRALRTLLESDPSLHGKITLVQVVVPSRIDIPKYQQLRLDVERLISSINGRFGSPGWTPIHYLYRHLERSELLAYYRAAEIALVTPMKDGMNLVCKEYCAAQVEEQGVLILSEFAGATSQFQDNALVVNPNDQEAVARSIQQALVMGPAERQRRMGNLRAIVREENVYRWFARFLREGQLARATGPAVELAAS